MSEDNKKKSNKDKLNDLEEEFKAMESQHTLNVNQYLVDPEEDLPEFGKLDVYDYETDMTFAEDKSEDVIESLVDLYLGDSETIKNHPYIIQKMKQDMEDYADSRFLSMMAKKLMLQNLKQIDSGDNGARMYEVATKLMGEIREINKDSRSSRSEIESFYKELRQDMGLNEISNSTDKVDEEEDTGIIIDTAKLSKQVDDILKGKNDTNSEI
jgi:hypothetical protein